jgi:hypothetical protein
MVSAKIDIFEMSYEESVSYFNYLENLQKIKSTHGPSPALLPLYNNKRVSVSSSVAKPSKDHKGYNIWCHFCDKNNHNTTDLSVIAKFKQQKNNKACFEAKAGPGKNFLAFLALFEEINAIKRQLKPEKTAVRKGRLNPSSLLQVT